jgi:hypothetical protein
MVLTSELAKRTVNILGERHIFWLDTQPVRIVKDRIIGAWQANLLDEMRAYENYLAARSFDDYQEIRTITK